MPSIKVNGIEVNYQTFGQGPPLLFIHGLGSSGRDWEYQFTPFSDDFQVIIFDVRGHGKSSKPAGPYSVPLFAKDCAAMLKVLDVEKPHVVGVSMGAMIGLQLAVDYPEMVKSLVVVNTGPDLVVRSPRDLFLLWQRLLIVRLLGVRKLGEVLSKRLFPNTEQADLRQIFVERWAENDPRAYWDTLKGLVGWSVVDDLDSIQCPTLVVAADQDYTPLDKKHIFLERIPNVQLAVIEESHHAAPVEKPEEFNLLLHEFLKAIG